MSQASPQQSPASANPFLQTFELAALGIAHIAPDGRLLRVNPRLCEMHGYSQEQLLRLSAYDLMVGGSQTSSADLQRLLAGEVPRYVAHRRFIRHDGTIYPAKVTVSLGRDENGERFVLSFIEDVSDLEQLNQALEARVAQRTRDLEESNRDLRLFAFALAHDLRGPITTIEGFGAELQRTLGELPDKPAHYLRRMRAGVQSMSQLIDGLLALTRLTDAPLDRKRVDLAALADAWLAQAREAEPGRQVAVDIERPLPAYGDHRLLADVLHNLLGNAWKFTAGTPGARIELRSATAPAGRRGFLVRDNGVGFDPADASRLFEPFQRLHGPAQFPGSGLGLAIVRRIVARHGGDIAVEAAPGQGATFRFTLEDGAPRS